MKITGLKPNFQNPLRILTGTQLQHDLVQNEEPVITIELESPECNILGVNPAPENESEDTLSTELISEVDFPPDYIQNVTTDDGNSSDENTIDDYYEIEHTMGNRNF